MATYVEFVCVCMHTLRLRVNMHERVFACEYA